MSFSVLMSVYNKEKSSYLNECLNSLCVQTLKPDEVVLVEDGPISYELSKVIKDYKSILNIKSVYIKKNINFANALNIGLKKCSHELIARMDTDDISLPDRFSKQVRFMKRNKNIAASSGNIYKFYDNGKIFGRRLLPTKHKDIVSYAKFRSPLNHPAVIYRKSAVLAVGGYPKFKHGQDYALWSLLIVRGFKLANLPNFLVKMRTGDDMLKRRGLEFFKNEVRLLRFQKSIKFLTFANYFFNFTFRLIIRLSPVFFRRWFYRVIK